MGICVDSKWKRFVRREMLRRMKIKRMRLVFAWILKWGRYRIICSLDDDIKSKMRKQACNFNAHLAWSSFKHFIQSCFLRKWRYFGQINDRPKICVKFRRWLQKTWKSLHVTRSVLDFWKSVQLSAYEVSSVHTARQKAWIGMDFTI